MRTGAGLRSHEQVRLAAALSRDVDAEASEPVRHVSADLIAFACSACADPNDTTATFCVTRCPRTQSF